MSSPHVIVLVCGKRKSGKDFICDKLKASLNEECTIVKISEPLKRLFAKSHQLDFNLLLSDAPYKEIYRREMIEWSDEMRNKDPGYFCKIACDNAHVTPIWIVSDVRRKTDIDWFKSTYPNKIKMVRIAAADYVRQQRGWSFTKGVDDVASECDLDDFDQWDLQMWNNDSNCAENGVQDILSTIRAVLA